MESSAATDQEPATEAACPAISRPAAEGVVPLCEVVRLAVLDARPALEPGIELRRTPFPDVAISGELREYLKSWLIFLAQQAGSNRGVMYLNASKRKRRLEIHLRLFETGAAAGGAPLPAGGDAEPTTGELEALSGIGGEFQMISKYPETSVLLKIPLPA